jgi:hypothetical protein
MKKQILSEEFRRMQKLAGIITESENIEEVSLSGLMDKFKDKITNLPIFQKFIDTVVAKMSEEDKAKFKSKFNISEAKSGPSLEDIMAKVQAANSDADIQEAIDPDSFSGKIVNLVRNLTGINLVSLGGAPLGVLITYLVDTPGFNAAAGMLISLVASLIIHGISRKLLGMSGDEPIVGSN